MLKRKALVFLVAKTLKDTTNHSLKLANAFSLKPIPFKANVSIYFNVSSQYSGAIKAWKFLSHKQLNKNLKLQTDYQFHHLTIKLQGIHQICSKIQEQE